MKSTNQPTVCLAVTAEQTATTFYGGYIAHLVSKGWRVYLMASPSGRLEEFSQGQGATAIAIPMHREPSVVSDLVSLARMLRALSRIRPNVVVAATPKAGLIGMLGAFLCRVDVRIYQLWGLRFETERGMRRRILAFLESASCRLSTQVVANSNSLARRAKQLGVLAKAGVTVLGEGSSHGVDLEKFSGDAMFAPPERRTLDFLARHPARLVVGFIGRIHRDKGLDTLIAALGICKSRGAAFNVLIVGGTEDIAIEAALRDAAELGVFLVGHVEDTRPMLSVIDVLCLPTLREGFPNVVLEAAAMGRPSIVSDATGAIDSVVDGVTGVIFRTGDPDSLADALLKLSSDPNRRAAMGVASRERAVRSFSNRRLWELQEENLRKQLRSTNRAL